MEEALLQEIPKHGCGAYFSSSDFSFAISRKEKTLTSVRYCPECETFSYQFGGDHLETNDRRKMALYLSVLVGEGKTLFSYKI